MPASAASRTQDEMLRSYMEEALRPSSIPRKLKVVAAGVALVGLLWWYTRDNPLLATLILGVVALHELGHMLAALALGVRERSGVWLNPSLEPVSGWREAIIALSGPVPGLIVALVLMAGFVQGATGTQPATIAYALALYNGLNLLPFYPLDGGRLLHALVFGRHPWLEVGFRFFAAAGLACGAFYAANLWLLIFAVFPFLGLRAAFALGLQAQSLRRRRVAADLSDLEIQAAVARAFPAERRPGVIARRALRMRALAALRPDPPAALIALGLGYALAGAAAVIVTSFPSLLG